MGIRSKTQLTAAILEKHKHLELIGCFCIGTDQVDTKKANALGIPVLGLYLPGEPLRTFPQGKAQSMMIHKSSPLELDVEEVVAGARALLAKEAL